MSPRVEKNECADFRTHSLPMTPARLVSMFCSASLAFTAHVSGMRGRASVVSPLVADTPRFSACLFSCLPSCLHACWLSRMRRCACVRSPLLASLPLGQQRRESQPRPPARPHARLPRRRRHPWCLRQCVRVAREGGGASKFCAAWSGAFGRAQLPDQRRGPGGGTTRIRVPLFVSTHTHTSLCHLCGGA